MDGIEIDGIASHIGSQLLDVAPFIDALDRVLALVARLAAQGIQLRHLDVGGGLGVRYHDEQPIAPRDWAAALRPKLQRSEEHTSELQSLMRISYAVFCLQKKKQKQLIPTTITI